MIEKYRINLAILYLFFITACVTPTKMWQADRMVDGGKYREAIAMYTQIMQSNPGMETAREAHLKAGIVYYNHLNDTEKALSIFERIVKDYPRSNQAVESLWLLGTHYYDNGEYQQARNKFIQLILDFSDSDKTKSDKLQIAACYEQLNKYQEAISTYSEFERFYPRDSKIPQIVLKKGELYEQLSQKDKAILEYQRVVNDFPSFYSEVNKARQRLEILGANERLAEEQDGEIRQIGPKARPDARAELARWTISPTFGYNPRELLMGESGNSLFGGIELEESLNSDGALLDDAVYNMGLMYYMIEDYKKAGACLEKAVEIGVKSADAYLRLGVCYREVGSVEKAKETFKTVAKIAPNVMENLLMDSENQAANGNYEKAINSLEMILGISETIDKQIYPLLSTIYQKKGDAKKAEEYRKLSEKK
ncbi:tetratricopeptide repeat protein [Candidatus Poribacteria bacterium]|nr:tetratricopeptide repeat protein [Candidatus Poribacteria bacterium]